MRLALPYGREGLIVDLPDRNVDVVEPYHTPALQDETAAIVSALRQPLDRQPLRAMVSPGDRVVLVVNDGTRPMPSARVLPPILAELAHVPPDQISVLVATGTHRANSAVELAEMLGPGIVAHYKVVNHDARDPYQLEYLGCSSRGHPIWIDKHYLNADVKILTGFIEPHFFAGFSGGPKLVMPGLAGLETVSANHAPDMIADPNATFGVLENNPIHEEQREIALLTSPTFSVNVALNRRREITGVWAGEMVAVHAAGVEFVRRATSRILSHPYDVVLTTNSGYPLDQNLYQSVKGMAAAAPAVSADGAIVLCAECSDGLPDFGIFATLLREAPDAETLLARVQAAQPPLPDGWQGQILGRILRHARVHLYSRLPESVVQQTLLLPCSDAGARVRELLAASGPEASLLVLPEGPQTIVTVG